jgi:hypothetical protein
MAVSASLLICRAIRWKVSPFASLHICLWSQSSSITCSRCPARPSIEDAASTTTCVLVSMGSKKDKEPHHSNRQFERSFRLYYAEVFKVFIQMLEVCVELNQEFGVFPKGLHQVISSTASTERCNVGYYFAQSSTVASSVRGAEKCYGRRILSNGSIDTIIVVGRQESLYQSQNIKPVHFRSLRECIAPV